MPGNRISYVLFCVYLLISGTISYCGGDGSPGTGCPEAVGLFLGDLQKLLGCGSEHFALGVPAGTRTGPETSRDPFPPQPFFDSGTCKTAFPQNKYED